MPNEKEIGRIASLWRYPVKSMIGESLPSVRVEDKGLSGDRSYALIDKATGKVVTAKNPRKWPTIFGFSATISESSSSSNNIPPVRIRLADGSLVTSDQKNINQILSKALKHEVILAVTNGFDTVGVHSPLPGSWTASSEEYWPDMVEREKRDTVTNFELPIGTFFDDAKLHLLTTATIAKLSDCYPKGDFKVQRFRPNIVVESFRGKLSFTENNWVDHTVFIGDQVRLKIEKPCPRCVMITLPQGGIPKDIGVLRTAVKHNQGNVGVYASVLQSGLIRSGDKVRIGESSRDRTEGLLK